MFGLTVEKLVVIAVIAAIIIGPSRLPHYAQRLGEFARAFRDLVDGARERVAAESGMSADDWAQLDPRRYDPRRIVREALEPATPAPAVASPQVLVSAGPGEDGDRPDPAGVVPGAPMSRTSSVAPQTGTDVRADADVRDGADATAAPDPARAADPVGTAPAGTDPTEDATPPATGSPSGSAAGDAAATAPARRKTWVLVGGTSGHPRRMLVDVPDEDPAEGAPVGAAERQEADRGVEAGVAA